MFSLIITVIAIALVAALALATLYYGGPIFNEGAERAQAAKLASQGQQIMGAMELYHAEKGVYPQSLNDLVADEYLKSIPVAQAEEAKALASAFAATTTWTLSSPGQPVIVLKPVSLATCKAYNQANVGVSGVLQQAHSTKLKQCVGTDVNNLMIIQPKAAADLIYVSTDPAAVVQIGAVLNTPIPTLADTTPNGWLDLVGGPVLSYFGTDGVTPLASLTFGDTETGATSAAATVLVKNTGASAFNFAAQSATIGAPFQILDNTCSGALAAGTSCVVSVTFSPALAQAYSGPAYALQLASTNSGTRTFAVSGTGIAAPVGGGTVVAVTQLNLVPDEYRVGSGLYRLRMTEPSTNFFQWTGTWDGGRWENNAEFFYPFWVTTWGGIDVHLPSEERLEPALVGSSLVAHAYGPGQSGFLPDPAGVTQPLTFYALYSSAASGPVSGSPVAQLAPWTTADAGGPTWCITWSDTGRTLSHATGWNGETGPVPELVGVGVSGPCP
jgi:hypothetical protein